MSTWLPCRHWRGQSQRCLWEPINTGGCRRGSFQIHDPSRRWRLWLWMNEWQGRAWISDKLDNWLVIARKRLGWLPVVA